jgi:hypothetical protein
VPTIITWVNIIKNKVDVETDEKDQVEEAIKTKQNAEYTLTATTCVPILKTTGYTDCSCKDSCT